MHNRLLKPVSGPQLESFIHALPDAALAFDDQRRVLCANEAGLALFGVSELGDVAALVSIDSAFAPLETVIGQAGDFPQTFETTSDRRRQEFRLIVSRFDLLPDGQPVSLALIRDVTGLHDLERFKAEVIKMASHDMRSPLALIIGYCDLMRMDSPPESPVQEYVDIVTRSTRRMTGLLNDLMRVEEIRVVPLEVAQPMAFAGLVEKVLENLRLMADAKHQMVKAEIALDGLELVLVAPLQFREAMENLTTNASKHTPEGGAIRVQASYDARRVYFVVQDNGVGIPAEDLARLFQWGFRFKRNPNPSVEDPGMGLAQVKAVLERHEGDLWGESEQGVGSTFGLWLPRAGLRAEE